MEQAPPEPGPAVRTPRPRPGPADTWWWVPGAITVITIASVIVVTLSQLHPSMLLTNTTTTGGDTGAHIAMPKFLESLLATAISRAGIRAGTTASPSTPSTSRFPTSSSPSAAGSSLTASRSSWGRSSARSCCPSAPGPAAGSSDSGLRSRPCWPRPRCPFLFDYTFTIYGGNLFSTLAGEYAYSFSLSLAVLFLGLFACAVREGRYRGWAAIVLAVCVLSHIVPGMYALGGAVDPHDRRAAAGALGDRRLVPARLARRRHSGPVPRTRTLWWAVSTVAIGLLLSGWWLVPFGLEHAYSSSMGYTNVEGWAQYFREADAWALVLAGIGAITAVVTRSRFGITVTVLGIVSALATAVDPQGSLYNVRLLPLWFISVYFMAAWAFGTWCVDRGDGLASGPRQRMGSRRSELSGPKSRRLSRPGTSQAPRVGPCPRRILPVGATAVGHPHRRRHPGAGVRPPSVAPSSACSP